MKKKGRRDEAIEMWKANRQNLLNAVDQDDTELDERQRIKEHTRGAEKQWEGL